MISLRLVEDRFATAVLDIDGDAVERVAGEACEKGHATAACGIDVFDRMDSSAAGLGWESDLPLLKEYLAVTDFDEATKWAVEHGQADYMWSRRTVCAYVSTQAMPLLKQGIRINAICPGPTDTPLARANEERWLGFGTDFRAEVGSSPATPLEQAYPLLFLCSDAASAVNGITLTADSGYFTAGITESFSGEDRNTSAMSPSMVLGNAAPEVRLRRGSQPPPRTPARAVSV
ncbi:SDR family oxidoreductase [Frankia sp. Mgl5]|uniref:SDR family oxidoreductase n=1 Tax=Frankia sp. Mgl5 TaxID=2933793 RepID=UPI00200BB4E1|nr:SDR family oxidoreductase [Frankia sp. Mgl5]MCK9929619.1 SDR family oxidoreductase [Frankia sp. Mgl5]